MTGPECTCTDLQRATVCHDLRYEPHVVGCPRWRTPHAYRGPLWPGMPDVDVPLPPLRVDSQRVCCDHHGGWADAPSCEDLEPVRPSWDEYGLGLARAVAARADCTRRQVGAVIIDAEHRVVATGYNGAPAGQPGCLSDGACPRGRLSADEQAPSVGYDRPDARCDALHAEMNAVIYAGRDRAQGATLYCTDEPCHMCALVIAAAGIDRVVVA